MKALRVTITQVLIAVEIIPGDTSDIPVGPLSEEQQAAMQLGATEAAQDIPAGYELAQMVVSGEIIEL